MNGSKMLWHMDRVLDWDRRNNRIAPLFIDIGATKKCNARCRFCYGIWQELDGSVIPRDVLCNLLRDAPRLGVKGMTFTGDGEPTLNPALYDAIEIGRKEGLDIAVATNGIALDVYKIRRLLANCIWVRFTICGAIQKAYKHMHGVDMFHMVKSHIRTAVGEREDGWATIGMQMVLTPDCFDQIIPMAEMALELGVDYLQIKQFSDPGDERMHPFDYAEYQKVIAKLKEAEAMSNDKTNIIIKWSMINDVDNKKPYDHCNSLPFLFQISGNSKCYPCGYLFNREEYCYGDLKEQSFEEIITSERYWNIIKYMANDFDVHTQCMGNCRHRFVLEFLHEYLNPPEHVNFI